MQLAEFQLDAAPIRLCEPVDFLDFLQLEKNARLVLTDSGGVQEETCILKVPCVTLRENTERPATVTHGTNQVVGTETAAILAGFQRGLARSGPPQRPALWDGHTAGRIVTVFQEYLGRA